MTVVETAPAWLEGVRHYVDTEELRSSADLRYPESPTVPCGNDERVTYDEFVASLPTALAVCVVCQGATESGIHDPRQLSLCFLLLNFFTENQSVRADVGAALHVQVHRRQRGLDLPRCRTHSR